MLILAFTLLALGLLIGGILLARAWPRDPELGIVLGIVGACCLIALLVTSIAIPINNLGRVAALDAFYEANAANYAVAVQETEDVLTVSLEQLEALIPIQGSVEKLDVGGEVSKRITEWRDKVNAYNTTLKQFRAYDGNIWVGIYFPTPSGNLKPIVIGP